MNQNSTTKNNQENKNGYEGAFARARAHAPISAPIHAHAHEGAKSRSRISLLPLLVAFAVTMIVGVGNVWGQKTISFTRKSNNYLQKNNVSGTSSDDGTLTSNSTTGAGKGTWEVPSGVKTVKVHGIGGGGGGGGAFTETKRYNRTAAAASGGGGGAYDYDIVSVSGGTSYYVFVGAAGSGGNGGSGTTNSNFTQASDGDDGTASWFDASSTPTNPVMKANGGLGGKAANVSITQQGSGICYSGLYYAAPGVSSVAKIHKGYDGGAGLQGSATVSYNSWGCASSESATGGKGGYAGGNVNSISFAGGQQNGVTANTEEGKNGNQGLQYGGGGSGASAADYKMASSNGGWSYKHGTGGNGYNGIVWVEYINMSVSCSQNVTCPGGNDGRITITMTAYKNATDSYTYSYKRKGTNEGQNDIPFTGTNATITGLSKGTYVVTVTFNGELECEREIEVKELAHLVTNITPTKVTCFGRFDGSAVVELTTSKWNEVSFTPSASDVTYQWYNSNGSISGATDATLSNRPAGTYRVKMVVALPNDISCTVYDTVEITQPTAITALILPTTIAVCEGDSVTLSAAATGGDSDTYTYTWTNTDANSTFTKTGSSLGLNTTGWPAGDSTYTVSVVNGSGCPNNIINSNAPSSKVTVRARPTVTVSPKDTTICSGNTAELTATDGLSYSWNNGKTTRSITVGNDSVYIVTATDANGCSNTDTATVTVNTQPNITNITAPLNVAVNSTAEVSVRPLMDDEKITWSVTSYTANNTPGQVSIETQCLNDTPPCDINIIELKGVAIGDVKVKATIYKPNNLDACKTREVEKLIKVEANVMEVICPHPAEDTIVYDGVLHKIDPQDYPIVVKNNNGVDITKECKFTYSVDEISFPDTVPGRIEAGTTQVTVKATHSAGNYSPNTCSYNLTVNQRPVTVKVVDCAAWTGSAHVTNVANSMVVVSPSDSDLVTGHQISGTVTTQSANGGFYTYSDTTSINNAVKAGVKVMNGTEDVTANYNITLHSEQTIRELQLVSVKHLTCHDGTNGEITVKAIPLDTAATSIYTYTLTPAGGEFARNASTGTATYSKLENGSYSLYAKYDDNCRTNTLDTVIHNILEIVLTTEKDTMCPGGNASLKVTATGGSGSYTYQWKQDNTDVTNGNQAIVSVSPTSTTEYKVIVTDQADNSCSKEATTTVTVFQPKVTLKTMEDQTICLDGSATLKADTIKAETNGDPTYKWNTNDETAQITVSPTMTTTYTVTATATVTEGTHTCKASDSKSVKVTVNTAPNPTNINAPSIVAIDDSVLVSVRPLVTGEQVIWNIESLTEGNTTGEVNEVHIMTPGVTLNVPCDTNMIRLHGDVIGKVKVYAKIHKASNSSDCQNSPEVSATIEVRPSAMEVECPSDKVKVYDSVPFNGGVTNGNIMVTVRVNGETNTLAENTDYTLTYSYVDENENTITQNTPPAITDAGALQVLVTATHTQGSYDSNTCQYTLTVNQRPVTVKVVDCAAWTGSAHVTNVVDAMVMGPAQDSLVTGHHISGTVTTQSANGGLYTYSDTTNLNNAIKAGVKIEDDEHHDVTDNYQITLHSEQTIQELQLVSVKHLTCHDGNNGEITVKAIPLDTASISIYTYYLNNTETDVTRNPSTGTASYSDLVHLANNGRYNFYAKNGSCQTNMLDTVIRNIDPISLITEKDTMCAGGNASLKVTATGGSGNYTYQWKHGTTNVPNGDQAIVSVSPTSTTVYTVIVSDLADNTCHEEATTTVTVFQPSIALKEIANQTICLGGSATLKADTIKAETNGTVTYKWNTDETDAQITVTPTTNTTYTVTATATVSEATHTCPATTSKQVTVTVNTLPNATNLNVPSIIAINDSAVVSIRPLVSGEKVDWTITQVAGTEGAVTILTPANFLTDTNAIKLRGDAIGKVRVEAVITQTHNLATCNHITVFDTIEVTQSAIKLVCPTPAMDSIVYDGGLHKIDWEHYPITVTNNAGEDITADCEFTYSTDGEPFFDTIPGRINAGVTQVTVMASHDQYEPNTCQYTLAVNQRPVKVEVVECKAWNGYRDTTQIASHYTIAEGNLIGENTTVSGKIISSSAAGGVYTYSDETTVNTSSKSEVKIMNGNEDVTDNYAITINATQTIMQVQLVSVKDLTCHNGANGEIKVTASPDSANYKYYINNVYTNIENHTFTGLEKGTYTIIVKNSTENCASNVLTDSVENIDPIVVTPMTNSIDLCFGESTRLEVAAEGGSGLFNYLWTDTKMDTVVGTTAAVNSGITQDTTRYTVRVSDRNDDTCFVEAVCTVNVRPAYQTEISGDNEVCQNAFLMLEEIKTASEEDLYDYQWAVGDGEGGSITSLTTEREAQLTWSTPGVKHVKVIVTEKSSGCESVATYEVQVDSIPVLVFNNYPARFCQGQDSVLLAVTKMANSHYSWNVTGSPDTNQIKIGAAGNYTVEVTDGNGCSSSAMAVVGAYPLPTVKLNNGNTTYNICPGQQQAVLTASPVADFTYIWMRGNEILNDGTQTVITMDTITRKGVYRVKVIDSVGCYAYSNDVQVNHFVLPVVEVNNPKVCESDTVTLTANGGQTYTWEPTTNLVSINGSYAKFHATPAGTYTVTVTGEDGNHCLGTAVSTITVVPDIKLTINNEALLNQNVCAGTPLDIIKIHVEHGTLELSGNLPYNVIFHGEDNPVVSNDTIDGITYQVGSFNYSIVATSDQTPRCASKQLNGFIKVNPMVEVTITPAAQDVCAGGDIDTVEITCANGILPTTLEAPQGLTYLRVNDTKARFYGKVANLTTTTELTIPVKVESDQTDPICDPLIENIVITVHPNPVVKIAELEDVCPAAGTQEVTANITTATTPDYTFYWSGGVWVDTTGSKNHGVGVSKVHANVPTVCIDSFFLRVEVLDAYGCYAMDTTMMVVQDTTKPQIMPIHNPVMAKGVGNCKFEVINLRDSVIVEDACSTGSFNFFQDVEPGTWFTADETSKVVNVWVRGSCNESLHVPITVVKPAPVDVHITSADTVCKGSGTEMTAAATTGVDGNITYTWTPNTGLSGTTTAVVTASPTTTTTYTVTARDGNGCVDTAMKTINVYPLPVVTIDDVATLCPNAGEAEITAHVDANGGDGTVFTYHWTCADFNLDETVDNDTSNTQQITNIPTGTCNATYTLNLEVTENARNCKTTASTVITVKDDVNPTITPDFDIAWAVSSGGTGCVYTMPNLTDSAYIYTDGCTTMWTSISQSVTVGQVINETTPVTITVTDACGNSAQTVVRVNVHNEFEIEDEQITVTPVSCYGGNDGTVSIYIPQTQESYLYKIDEGEYGTSTLFTDLTAGLHYITVKNTASECSSTFPVTVGGPDPFTMTIEGVTQATCADNNGTVTISVTGGNSYSNNRYDFDYIGNLTYSDDTYTKFERATVSTLNNLPVGKYYVTVSDKEECAITDSFEITLNDNLVVESIPVPKPTCSGGSFATIPVNNTPGTTYYTWPQPDQSVANGVSGTDAAELADHKTAVSDEGLVNNTNEPVNLTYHVTAHNGVCTYTSDLVMTVTATVRPPVVITPIDTIVCPSALDGFKLTANLANVYADVDTLIWRFNNDSLGMQTHTYPSSSYTERYAVDIPASECRREYGFVVEYSDGICTSSKDGKVTVRIPDNFTIVAPAFTDTTVSCTRYIQMPHLVPSKWPSLITDGCGQVIDTFVNVSYPFLTDTTCNNEVVFVYTFQDCSGNDTTYKYTYHVVRGAMTLPADGADTVICESNAVMPRDPGGLPDACEKNVMPTFPDTWEGNPNPRSTVSEGRGTVTYTFLYTTCDGQVYPWRFVYTVIPEPFTPYESVTSELHCQSEMVAPDAVPLPDTTICGTHISFNLNANYPQDVFVGECGTRTYRYDYRVNGEDYEWYYIETVDPADFTMPKNDTIVVACYSDINTGNIPLPEVFNACGNPLTPVNANPVVTPDESQWGACYGEVVCTYTYKDCHGHSHDWSYVWVVKDTLAPIFISLPENGVVPAAHKIVNGNCVYEYPSLSDMDVLAYAACDWNNAESSMIIYSQDPDPLYEFDYIEQTDEVQHLPMEVVAESGCGVKSYATVYVEVPAKLRLNEVLSDHKNVTCFGGSNGQLRYVAGGGTPFVDGSYTFEINEPAATQSQPGYFTGLPVPADSTYGVSDSTQVPNYYTNTVAVFANGIWYGHDIVTVTDDHGCNVSDTVEVSSPVLVEFENCVDRVVLCADPGKDYRTVTIGKDGDIVPPTPSTMANNSSLLHTIYKERYNVGITTIRYTLSCRPCRQNDVCEMLVQVLPNASVKDSAANMKQEVCPNADIDPIVFTFANADSISFTGLPANMVTYEKRQVTTYTTETTVTISGNPQATAPTVLNYTFTAYSQAVPGTNLPCSDVTYSGSITIHDTVAPTFTKPIDTVAYVNAQCVADVTPENTGMLTNDNIEDNCSDQFTVTYRDENADGTCAGSYIIHRVWRVVDPSGNVSKSDSIQTITVLDTVSPVIAANHTTEFVAIPNSNCNSNVPNVCDEILTFASDNCGGTLRAEQQPVAGTEILENTPVTVTVYDECGNSSSVTVNVTAAGVVSITVDSVDAGCYDDLTDGTVFFTIRGAENSYATSLDQTRNFVFVPYQQDTVGNLADGDHLIEVFATIPGTNERCISTKTFTVQPIQEMLTISANNGEWEYDAQEHANRSFTVIFGNQVVSDSVVSGSAVYLPNGDRVRAEVTGAITDAGTVVNTLSGVQVARGTTDVTCYYNQTLNNGTLTVNPAEVTVTITGHHLVADYDGNVHTVSGYDMATTDAFFTREYFAFDGDSLLAQVAAGTYNMNLDPSQFTSTWPTSNNVSSVTFEVAADGYLTINKINATVNIAGNQSSHDFDGAAHSISGFVATADPASLYGVDTSFTFTPAIGAVMIDGVISAMRTNAGTDFMGLAPEQFANINPNFDQVTFIVTDGWMRIDPIDVTVTVTGHDNTADYDGEEHVVSGYDLVFSTPLYTVNDFTFSGVDTAKRTNAGTTSMNLAAGQFTNTNSNFDEVTFNVTDGYQTINPIDVAVTVTGHHNTANYDGTEHVITGYDLVFSKPLYTSADFTFSGVDTAKRTDAGTTNMGLNANQFANTNNNFATVTFNVTDGYQTINKINATVTITGHHDVVVYDTQEHQVNGYETQFSTPLYTRADFNFTGDSLLNLTNIGTVNMHLAPAQFTNLNTTNFDTVNFNVAEDGYLTINPLNVTVTVTGHTNTTTFDNTEHMVTGFDKVISSPLYTANDFTFNGTATASRTNVVEGTDVDGQTDMGLTANMFTNLNPNCNVIFNVTDGYQKIMPVDDVVVTIAGEQSSVFYDGEEHSVSGYSVAINHPLYHQSDYTFNGTAEASRTDVGTAYMGLNADQFTNINTNFTNVTFDVTDGHQIVEPNSAQVTIIGHTRTVAYNGSEQTVTGYDVVSSNTLYGAADFTFTNGDSTATRQFVGTTSMGLNETMFHNTNPNFANNVTFTVQDGSITVTPANAVVTIVGANNTTAYDGAEHTVTGFTPTADLTFYNVDTSFTFTPAANAVMVGDEIAAKRTDAGTTNMGLAVSQFANTNPNFNVTFNVTDGYQTITPLDVTVTITGANNTTTYDREEHSVSGYNVQVSSPLYTENDFAFNGTAYAAQTEIGTANMGLDANQFVNNNNNFNVTFDVTDGYQTITRVTGVVVTITGHNKTEHYNGSEQSVSGYEVSTNNTLYTEADFTFDGTAYAARTDTGIVWMGLEGHFANTNDNFSGVTFNVTDGFMRVTQLPVTVTITGHSDSRYFDNAQHEVSGFDTVISSPLYTATDFTFAGNNAYASRTHVVEGNDNTGKTMMGLDVAHFTNTNANFDVTFNVTDGYQEIMPVDDVVVTIKGAQSSVFYDGEEHSVSGYAATINHPLYHESDYDFNGTAAAAQTNVGTAYMGLNASQFTNHNTDFTNVTFDVTDGHQIVEPNSAQVTIIGHTRTVTYNGEAQVVKGYDIQSSNTLYGAADFTFTNGDSTATRQFVGTTTMGLSEAMFQNTNPNFVNNVTFTVQDGSITVVPADAVVTIVGKNNTAPYDGAEHTVTGYTSTADLTFYNVDTSFTFNGTAQASRTFVGTTNMGLAVGQFTNKNPNFNVTFNVTDGYQTITPIDVTVTIVGDHNTAPYDGSVHTVTGYTATANPTIYNVDTSFTFSGPTTASRMNAGTTNMGLTADQFANTNPNFANVTFNVTDGYQTITPINAVVTVVGNHAENVFDNAAHTVTGFTATANTNLYKTTGNNRDFTFEGQATATRTSVVEGADNSGKTMMGLTADMFANTNSNFATVTFNVTDGYQKINQAPVTVTIKGAVDSVLYLDQVEQSVHGYEVTSISNPLYTEENFSYVGDADDTVATGMAVATYYMNLSAQSFQDNGTDYCKNFAPTFNVTNGHLAILSRHVTVTIAGNADTVEYDGQSHQVNGYQVVNIDQPHYTANDFSFDGAATASRTNAGTTSMGLAAEQFHNQNANYQEVTFVVTDGFVTVTPKPIAVTVTGNNDTANYTGTAHTVTGFEYATAETLYNTDSCEYHGTQADSTATRTDAGTTPMGLTADEFVNTDDNFTVTFNVVDGYQYVVPDTVKVTITGQHNEFAFDNSEHTVSGYTFATTPAQTAYDPYAYVTFIGTTPATASRTDAGTTNMGLTAAMFSNSNSNYYVTFEVTDGYVKVNALPVTVNVEGNTGVFVYDNAGHTVSGYTVTATSDLFDVNCIQLVNGTTASVSATNANTNPYPMNLSQNSFQNTCNNSNFDVTIQVTDGWLRILGENEVYVKITGHRDTAYYDGASHMVSGYDVETVPANYTAYTFNGTATAARTNVVEGNDASGKTFMNLAVNQFSSTNNNYNVIFDVEDGYIWIKPIDTMVVTITGNTATQTYTRTEHTVTGYTSTANTTLFDANKVVFNGNSTASRTLAGTTHMGLVASQFSYNDQNFTNVTFNVHDGAMTVSKKPVSIIGDTIFHKIYDGDSLRVRYDLLTYNGFVDGDVITTGEIVTMGSHIGTYLCNQNNFMAFNDETYVAENRLFGEPSVIQNYAPAFNVTLRIDPVQELNVPDTVRIVLTEGTADTTVTTVEIGTPDNELPGTTIVNNLPDVNPLPADTTRVTWTIYDNEGNEMTHNDQVVIVVYAPCDTIEYNGYAYPAKRIGYQCWMTENLRTETYADGTTPVADYHAYMDNPANLEKFGYLYTWYSAVNVQENNNSATPAVLTAANGTSYVQGVCPEGWAVASVADYDVLYLHVGDVILLKDAGEGYWYPGNGGVLPNSGFNSRAGGLFKSMNDRYEDILTGDHYWKSDSTPNSANATSGNINYFCDAPSEVQSPKTDRKSVRCIKKR